MMSIRNARRATKILVFLQNIYKMVLDKQLAVKKGRNPFDFLSVYSSAEQFGREEFAIIAAALTLLSITENERSLTNLISFC